MSASDVHHFFVCVNARPPGAPLPSCGMGGKAVHEAFVREIAVRGNPAGLKVTATGCLTPCQVGPSVVVYPVGIWYAHVVPSDVAELIDAHLSGNYVERLLKPDSARIW